MCYRCDVCSAVVPHGQQRRVHQIMRTVTFKRLDNGSALSCQPRQEIAAEVPVCGDCLHQIKVVGVSLSRLRLRFSATLTEALQAPKAVAVKLPWLGRDILAPRQEATAPVEAPPAVAVGDKTPVGAKILEKMRGKQRL